MNNRFLITWSTAGKTRSIEKKGLNELSEFIRNSDAYERKILSIVALKD